MELYALALLPLCLASLFGPRLPRSTAAFFGALLPLAKFLAPVVASGVSSLIGHKKATNEAKTAEAQKKLDAERADAKAKADWEAQQNSPAAQTARFKSTVALGKLAGKFGGVAGVPPSIAKYYQSLRTMPEYTGQSSYIAPVKAKGGGWNLASGIVDALGYADPSQLKRGGGAPMSPGQPTGGGFGSFQTGQLAQLFKPKNPGFSSGTQDFG